MLVIHTKLLIIVLSDGLLHIQNVLASVTVALGMFDFLTQQLHLLLEVANIIFMDISRALCGLPVFLFLYSGLFLFGKFGTILMMMYFELFLSLRMVLLLLRVSFCDSRQEVASPMECDSVYPLIDLFNLILLLHLQFRVLTRQQLIAQSTIHLFQQISHHSKQSWHINPGVSKLINDNNCRRLQNNGCVDGLRSNAINYLFSIIFVINQEQKMDDLFEPHQPNTRLDLHSIFNNQHSHIPPKPTNDFVPFYQERDKLGKLISREQNRKKIETAGSEETIQARKHSLQVQLTERNKNSDKTVEKMFKVNTIRNSTSSRSLVKLKLALPQNKSSTPELGYYEAAQVTDKIKGRKGSLIGLKQIKPPNKQQQKKVSALLLNKMGAQMEKKSKRQQRVRVSEKLQLNPNLPELENFHRMQKLQFEIKGNFQKDHLRFKDIMRSSLLLANQIKRELEID